MISARNTLAWVLLLLVPLLLSAADAEDRAQISIPLQRHLRVLIRPTLLGLVPPVDGEGYGEVFVRVLQVSGSAVDVRYEIKESLADEKHDASLETRIRRGDIQVAGLDGGIGATPPLLWPDGNWTTEDGLIWLPRAGYQQLLETGSCPWRLNSQADELDAAAAELAVYISGLQPAELPEGEQFLLMLEAEDQYPCWVNGDRTELPAYRAVDSLGLAEYWILADAANPLLLKMSLIPPMRSETDHDESAGGLGLLDAGAGYAVVEINY